MGSSWRIQPKEWVFARMTPKMAGLATLRSGAELAARRSIAGKLCAKPKRWFLLPKKVVMSRIKATRRHRDEWEKTPPRTSFQVFFLSWRSLFRACFLTRLLLALPIHHSPLLATFTHVASIGYWIQGHFPRQRSLRARLACRSNSRRYPSRLPRHTIPRRFHRTYYNLVGP